MSTYRGAGVDLDAAGRTVDRIGPLVTSTWGEGVVGGFGGFAAGLRLPEGYRRPVLMMSTDGVGTKAEVARLAGRVEGLGFDLVAMCVDDLAAAGARPLALSDYIAIGRLDEDRVTALVASVAAACGVTGVALLGGEIAEHPGVMRPDGFDLAGAALGVVEEGSQIDGSAVVAGDRLIGVASPGIRCNGFSLVRAVVLPRLDPADTFPGTDRTVADVLLEPSVIYAPAAVAAAQAAPVHAFAHITGGGLAGNLIRVMPAGCRARVELDSWEPPAVFGGIAGLGMIEPGEMYSTFNMGTGYVAVVPAESVDPVISAFAAHGHDTWEIGEVVAGERAVDLVG